MREEHLRALRGCPLFERIAPDDLPAALGCLAGTTRTCQKDEAIFLMGQAATHMGIVLAGRVHVEQVDYWGNRAILAQLGPSELFGEAFGCAGVEKLPVSVYAMEAGEVMLVDVRKIVAGGACCGFQAQLTQNMLRILAQKNVALTQKIEAVSQRTTRDKLLAYLSHQARRCGSSRFNIPFNRQQLADYLAVDRSAMSSELSKMQKAGLLAFEKNRFELL